MSFHIRTIGSGKRRRKPQIPFKTLLKTSYLVGKPLWSLGKRFAERRRKEHRIKRAITVGVAAIVALCVALLALSLLINIGGISLSSALSITGTPVEADESGVTNILLLGQGDETGQDLTDAIIIASIDPVKTKSIAMLSLPRDLYFLHTDHAMEIEKGKLNALWRDNWLKLLKKGVPKEDARLEALKQLADEIGNAFAIRIHHVVMVDFEAFEEAVDTIGGIEVDVPETIHDEEYPGPNYTYQTFHVDAGRQHFDGATALKYVRTRSTTSDFDRSERQQQVIQETVKKAREEGVLKKPRKLLELFGILKDHILTDLKTRQLVTLASVAKDISQEKFLTLQLNNVNGLYGEQQWKGGILYSPPRDLFDGEFVMLPVSIPEFPVTWKQVQTLTELYFGNRELYLDHLNFSVLNGGAKEGAASRVGRELTKFGFDVSEVSNVPDRKEFATSNIVYQSSSDKNTADYFSKMLGIENELSSDAWRETLGDKAGDITIILGEDFEFGYFQDVVH